MTRLNEAGVIRELASSLRLKNLDDVALVSLLNRRIAFKCDMLVGSTDVPPQMSAEQIARKSIVSCISDFSSKGIRPVAAMIALGLEDSNSDLVSGLARGFAKASKEFRVEIVGGDTNRSNDLVIDCSMIGYAPARMPARSGAKAGDYVIVSGPFGYTASGLKILMQGAAATDPFRRKAVESVLEPKPAQKFGLALSKYFSSSMDSSDGLAISLYTIASQSKGVDITVERLPQAEGLEGFAGANPLELQRLVFYGGEEYEIVATIPAKKIEDARAAAKKNGLVLNVIGRVTRGTGKVFYQSRPVENTGYDHFA
ncbi:MAG TPA: thiamine-phosphate kinase [Nitrososphaera sp.]|nr:thiamine-phosphate kinase [Nitrososphaera sp.]